MRFKQITITNFRSFVGTQVFRFGDGPGLYFLGGRNEAEPELGANGAGKSSVWEAMCWALFGKTSRLLKASEVGNWEVGKECRVSFDFEHLQSSFRLTRTWSPNSLKLLDVSSGSEQDVVQGDLNTMLGTDFEPFLHSVFISQFSPMFLDLSPTEKAALLSGVMQLDRWIDFAEKASQRSKEADRILRTAEDDLNVLAGRISALEDLDFEAEIKAWEESKATSLAGIEEHYAALVAEKKELDPQIVAIQEQSTHNRKRSRELVTQAEEARSRAATLRAQMSAPSSKISRAEARIDDINQQMKFFRDEGQCPLCLQVMSIDHKHEQTGRLTSNRAIFMAEVEEAEAELEKLKRMSSESDRDYQMFLNDSTDFSSSAHKADIQLNTLRSRIKEIERELDRLEVEVDRMTKEVNPGLVKRQENESQIRGLKRQRIALQDARSDAEKRSMALGYWSKGFKDLRLFLISEALTQLEVEVNSELSNLGMVGWRIQFAVEQDTKSGTVRRGFSVLIQSPHNKDAVPWEAWSGGESQRLRLAVTMGLSNLILNNQGISPDVEIWDEPSRWLSDSGINDLLEALSARAHQLKRQIWVVDHRSLEFGGFLRTVTVVKDLKGSRIEDQIRNEEVPAAVPRRIVRAG